MSITHFFQVDEELRQIKNPKQMTARQKAMQEKKLQADTRKTPIKMQPSQGW